jgi:molecular chaperone DnaJ
VKHEKGSVLLHIEVLPHPTFHRSGKNIRIETRIPFTTAILGGTVTVPTIWGDVEMVIPPGTQPEESKKLRGKGIQGAHGTPGDQIVSFRVDIPKAVTGNQRKALEAFLKNLPVHAESQETPAGGGDPAESDTKKTAFKSWIKSKFKTDPSDSSSS